MKRLLLHLSIVAVVTAATLAPARAAVIAPQDALARIGSDNSQSQGLKRLKGRTSALRLAHTEQVNGQAAYYVFNVGSDGGFIIAPADDEAVAVAAYADSGAFDPSAMPDNMREWLRTYTLEIKALREGRVIKGATPKAETLTPVAPLLGSTIWNQSEPYNNQCPIISGSSTRSVTGCVATAFGQIMYYYKHPTMGTGSKSYTSQGTTYNMNYNTSYDWDSMQPYYTGSETTAQNNAVSKLMWHIGSAFDMIYGTSSGAFDFDAVKALIDYFHYDKSARLIQRDFYSLATWRALLRKELDAQRPVCYSGVTAKGAGHQFVIDGYDADGLFHVNWGWGGKSNGYFAITILTPAAQGIGGSSGGYNYRQAAVISLKPDAGAANYYCVPICDRFVPSASSVMKGSQIRFNVGNIYNITPHTSFSGQVAVGMYKDDQLVSTVSRTINLGECTVSYTSGNASLSYVSTNLGDLPVTFAAATAGTTYTFRLISRATGSDEWQYMGVMEPYNEIKATYDGNYYNFEYSSDADPTIFNVKATQCYQDMPAFLEFDVSNTNTIDGHMDISYAVTDASGNVTKQLGTEKIVAEAGVTTHFKIPFTIASTDLTTGNYYLTVFKDDGYDQLWGRCTFTLMAKPAAPVFEVRSISYPRGNVFTDNNLTIEFELYNTGGYYCGEFIAWILDENYQVISGTYFGQGVYQVPRYQATTLRFEGTVPLGPGNYHAILAKIENNNVEWVYKSYDDIADFTITDAIKGDINGDKAVDGNDVSILLEMVLAGGVSDAQIAVADLNGDKAVDGNDVSILLEMVLAGE